MLHLPGPPYEKQHIASNEGVQRSALRFVTGDYSRSSSVTAMRETLGWETLECRRRLAAATILYKSVNNLIYLPIPDSVRPAGSLHTLKPPLQALPHHYKHKCIQVLLLPPHNTLMEQSASYIRHCYQP